MTEQLMWGGIFPVSGRGKQRVDLGRGYTLFLDPPVACDSMHTDWSALLVHPDNTTGILGGFLSRADAIVSAQAWIDVNDREDSA